LAILDRRMYQANPTRGRMNLSPDPQGPDEAARLLNERFEALRAREFGNGRTLGPDLTVRDLIEFGRK